MIEIGKKSPKTRRSPQRSRERFTPKSNVSTAQCRLSRRDLVSRSGSKDHDDVTDEATKHVRKQGRWRRTAWDDDWHKINEQLRATAQEMDMAVIKLELATEETTFCASSSLCRTAGQHCACAQAQSFKPSVKARASKPKNIIINKQKQMRRNLTRQRRDMDHEKEKDKCCLVDSFRSLGIKVTNNQNGPFWVLADGLEMLRLHGYIAKPVARIRSTGPGRWLVCRGKHCIALRRKGEGNTWSIDGADRKRVAERDLDALVKGAKIYEVPRRRS